MQQLNDYMQEQSEHKKKSRSGKPELSGRTSIQRLVIVKGSQAVTTKEGMQMAKELQSKQMDRVIHGLRAPTQLYPPSFRSSPGIPSYRVTLAGKSVKGGAE